MKNGSMVLLFLLAPACAFAADAQTDAHLREGIALIIDTLPIQVDKRTTLTSLMLEPGHVLSYRYTIDMVGMLDDAAVKGHMTSAQLQQNLQTRAGSGWMKAWSEQYIVPYIVKSGCSQPFIQNLLKLGYSVNHTMNGIDGGYLFERTVTLSDCRT